MTDDFLRFLAAWALVHESADEGWKAAVRRGEERPEGMTGGPDAFVDGLSAAVAAEKERLKADLAAGGAAAHRDDAAAMDELRFEVGELRARVESMQATLDAIAARLGTG